MGNECCTLGLPNGPNMEQQRLIELLQQKSAEVSGQTRFCPDAELITNYFEGSLKERARSRLKRHLVDCRFCMARVGNLERSANKEKPQGVPGSILADAKRLYKPPLPSGSWGTPAWATAAVVVLAIAVGFNQFSDQQSTQGEAPVSMQSLTEIPLIRSIDKQAMGPEIVTPLVGQVLPVNEPEFEWTVVRGSLYYDVRLVSAEGEIVWEERVKSTSWSLPGQLQLRAGTDYYLRVDAYLAEAKRVSSRHVLFTTQEQH